VHKLKMGPLFCTPCALTKTTTAAQHLAKSKMSTPLTLSQVEMKEEKKTQLYTMLHNNNKALACSKTAYWLLQA